MREIGSEFWDVPITDQQNRLFPESTQWYLSGRSALKAIITELGETKSVSLPAWCCDSMVKPFYDAGLEVSFYPVYWQDRLVQEIDMSKDVLLVLDYFGYTSYTPDLSSYEGIVIRDVTHSHFSTTYSDADYYFGSLRKWCGVWTGGYAWNKECHKLEMGSKANQEYIALRKKAMFEKDEYICERKAKKDYLRDFEKAEKILESVEIEQAVDRDICSAHFLDVEDIRINRRRNAEVLRKAFADILIFPEILVSDCPMFVPILVPGGKRDALRDYLIKHDIFCPVHWAMSKYHVLNDKTAFIYQNELSLVCDQRYTEEDMNQIVKTIEAFWKEK